MTGARYERKLQRKLNSIEGTSIHRITGSGTGKGCFGDLIGGYLYDRVIIIEVKSTSKDKYYLSQDKEEFERLVSSTKDTIIEPFIAVRFKRPPEWVIKHLGFFDGKKVVRGMGSDLRITRA